MIGSLRTPTGKRFILFIGFLIITDLFILLDIPFLRQFLGFLFFTIVPGLLILYILKLNKMGLTEKVVLSVGISISFLMFFGLLINSVYPLFDYDTPLSTNSLLVSFSIILLILAIFAYLRSRTVSFAKLSDFKLNTREKAFLLLPAFFPLLGILGTRIMNITDNNAMLMALLLLIPAYTIVIALKHHQVPERIYPPMIFLTGIALLLLLALRSNHLIGSDVHDEYCFFQLVSASGQWQVFGGRTLDSCLSISLLPTIYQSFLNIDSEYLFKILYPLLFSVSPLVVYIISKKYIGNFYAFLASLFFMAQFCFSNTAGNARTSLAILFFALAMMVLFHSRLSEFNKRLLFTVFAVSCIVSHYSTTYIFFFVLLLAWIGMQVIPRIIPSQKKPVNSLGGDSPKPASQLSQSQIAPMEIRRPRLKSYITSGTVLLFFVVVFLWYSQLTGTAFVAGIGFISTTLRNLQQFFILELRGGVVSSALGGTLGLGLIPRYIEFVFSWLSVAFLVIGILTTLVRYQRMVAFPSHKEKGGTPEYFIRKIDPEFFILSLSCFAILVVSVALPFISAAYDMNRIYFQATAVLSPFFIIGAITVAKFLRFRWAHLIVLVVLIPYLMCTTNTMYQLLGAPRNIILNSTSPAYDFWYVHEQESYAAKWLEESKDKEIMVYTDPWGQRRLQSQSGIPRSRAQSDPFLLHLYLEGKEIDGYIYLRYQNVVKDEFYYRGSSVNISEYPTLLTGRNKIYASNGSEIYR